MKQIIVGLKQAIKPIFIRLFPDAMKMREIRAYGKMCDMLMEEYRRMTKEEKAARLAIRYREITGRELNVDDPKRFTDKLIWRILNYDHPVYSRLSDKYMVREWVARKIGEEYLIPLLGVWDKFDEIDFDALPDAFVLKTNHASGTNIIVKDKKALNRKTAKAWMDTWMKYPFCIFGYEAHYDRIRPKIIAEELMKPEDGADDIQDYKFLCFDGQPYYCWVDVDRWHGHKRNLYDMEWNLQEWICNADFPPVGRTIEKPGNFDVMIELVRKLSAGFAQVRVDLYNIGEKIYFGEMTFTSAAGMARCEPEEMDYFVGNLWDIHKRQVDEEVVNA